MPYGVDCSHRLQAMSFRYSLLGTSLYNIRQRHQPQHSKISHARMLVARLTGQVASIALPRVRRTVH